MRTSNPTNHHSKTAKAVALPFVLFAQLLILSMPATAQVKFVHLTDPHVFDDDWQPPRNTDPKRREDNRLDNRATFESCLSYLNERIKNGEQFDFAVITGDLGIEYLVKDKDIDQKIRAAAADFASMLTLSGIERWLIVPGNNDVWCEDPANVRYYQTFAEQVSAELRARNSRVTLTDLTPRAAAAIHSQAAIIEINGYDFIGFNNATFKNVEKFEEGENCPRRDRIRANAVEQKQYVTQVEDLIKKNPGKFAYIFYHIPEIDDPYLATLNRGDPNLSSRYANRALIGDSFFHSAWFVTRDVREAWNKVVINARVRGLFAGHFHDNKPQTYLNYSWQRTPNYLPETLDKLHVAPPLALKLQYDKSARARGFQEVYIDDKGDVTTRLVWLNHGRWGLADEVEAKESESRRQLALGDLYAGSGQLKEAEAAYVKAAESNWPPTRQAALRSANDVIDRQNWFSERYLKPPLRTALATAPTTAGLVVVTFLILAFVILVATPIARYIGRRRGRNKVKIVATSGSDQPSAVGFEQVMIMIHGRMQSHYSRRHTLLIGRQPLPMLFRSQTAELADLAESVAPGAVGKVIGWLIKKTDNPQYMIAGVVQTPSIRRILIRPLRDDAIFLALLERGNTLRTWHKTGDHGDFAELEIELAFKSLKHLARRQNP